MAERLVIVGGDAAGMSAASKAVRISKDVSVVVLERTGTASYAACGLPYYVEGLVPDARMLIARSPERFAEDGIDLRRLNEVVEIDLDRRDVKIVDKEAGREYREPFDQLLISTGAVATKPPVKGADAEGSVVLRNFDDGLVLRAILADAESFHKKPLRVVIVGGGYVGMELAEAVKALGHEVAVVEMLPHVFSTVDPEMSELVAAELVDKGVEVFTEEALVAVEDTPTGRVSGVTTTSRSLPADLVIFSSGVRPATELADAAGIPRDETGAIATDDYMRTPVDGVWSAGDCTSSTHLITGKRAWIPLGTTANKQGRIAGENMMGGQVRFGGIVGTAVAKVFDLEVARTGLGEAEASREGFEVATALITAGNKAHYYPGASPLKVKLLADRRDGKLLGGQIIGKSGAAKRIDVVATALHAGMTVEQFNALDLSYAPPFAPVWDPLLIAAQQLEKAL